MAGEVCDRKFGTIREEKFGCLSSKIKIPEESNELVPLVNT